MSEWPSLLNWKRPVPPVEVRLLKATVYLYESEDAAALGEPGGSGFIVGLPTEIPERVFLLAVSNAHVVETCPVIRTFGPRHKRVLSRTKYDWFANPEEDNDLKVTPLGLARRDCVDYYLDYVPAGWIVTPADFTHPASSPPVSPHGGGSLASNEHPAQQPLHWPFGPGDDVVMVGRFLGHDGAEENRPAVRFGNLAIAPPVVINHPHGYPQETFIIECRSVSGYSGAPVFIYRPWPLYGMPLPIGLTSESEPRLLGIDWGNLDRIARNTYGIDWAPDKHPKVPSSEEYPAVSGMMMAIPGWKLLDILKRKELKQMVDDATAKARTASEGVNVDCETEEETEFDQFEDLARTLVQVPKKEIDEKRKEF